jgi:Fe-S-cluster containining protein
VVPLSAGELEDRTFSCLAGCGFCCTFQPEASQRELARLRARLAPRPLAVVVGDGRSYLGLQNKCGACTLLARRECQAYDLRPAHCRYFPFHVHFGERAQVYVNETCRGVVRAPGSRLDAPFHDAVLSHARPEDMDAHAEGARAAYAEFKRNAQRAGAWDDIDAVLAEATRELAPTRAWLATAIRRADEEATPEEMVEDALAPFSAADVSKRPFYLAPDLRWLTFDGPSRLVEMDEAGALLPLGAIAAPSGWADLDGEVGAALRAYALELARRDVFTGSVYALVDDLDYETSVAEATWWRLAEVVVDIGVRARILLALGVAPADVPAETVRFYDSTFLDAPTIGGFL